MSKYTYSRLCKSTIEQLYCDWVDCLAGAGLVDQVNNQLIKWVAAFLDEGLAGWEMPQRQDGFYQAWRKLAQEDYSGTLLGIKDFFSKINDQKLSPRMENKLWGMMLFLMKYNNELNFFELKY